MTSALLVSRFFPYNAERVHGIYQRLGTQIEALARVVDRVHCLFLVPVDQPSGADVVRQHEERLRRLWSATLSIKLAPTVNENASYNRWQRIGEGILNFYAQFITRGTSTRAVIDAVSAELDARPNLVLAHRLTSMCPLMRIAQQAPEKLRGVPLFLDMDDIEHITLFRRLITDPGWPAERLLLLQLPALMLGEIRALHLTTATFVCSEVDRRCLGRLAHTRRVLTVPNSVVVPPGTESHVTEPLVLFVGAMGYRPNAQAADSLVQDIWPAVRAACPGARLAVIGPGAEHSASCRSADESVTFTGFVEDIASWYRRARVVCCPIYHGGGTRIKIIEAAAFSRAIVATHLAAEGLDFADGSEIILCDEPAALAAACVRLLNEPNTAARLGRAALLKARATYERGAVIDRLADIFRAGLANELRERVLV